MTDPTAMPIGAAWAAWFTAVILTYLGVDYYALLGAFAGVLFTLGNLRTVGVTRMVTTVAGMSFAAAVIGQGLASLATLNARPVLMLFSLACGAAGQILVQAIVEALLARIKKFGGGSPGSPGETP